MHLNLTVLLLLGKLNPMCDFISLLKQSARMTEHVKTHVCECTTAATESRLFQSAKHNSNLKKQKHKMNEKVQY